VLLNRNQTHEKTIGHLTGLTEEVGGAVHARGVLVDSVQDGFEAGELIRSGRYSLSIEFIGLGPAGTRISRSSSGGQLIEPASCCWTVSRWCRRAREKRQGHPARVSCGGGA